MGLGEPYRKARKSSWGNTEYSLFLAAIAPTTVKQNPLYARGPTNERFFSIQLRDFRHGKIVLAVSRSSSVYIMTSGSGTVMTLICLPFTTRNKKSQSSCS